MANPNLKDPLARKKIIEDIKSNENVERKRKALKAYEIFNDNACQYVKEDLVKQLSESTVKQMQIISNMNIAKAVVNKEATIYTDTPTRNYEDIQEADKEALENLYADCGYDSILSKANKYYKLNNQTFAHIIAKEQKLKLRVLHGHNLDVIPDSEDPERAYAYIISSFDKAMWLKGKADGVNQTTADQDDYKSSLERYQVWTSEFIFTMDGKGAILSEGILPNPLKMLPFIDISKDKDFEFFVRVGQALTDFTVDYNVSWSDIMFIMRMQGYSIGVLSGDPNLKPDSYTLGPSKMLFLPSNPSNPESSLKLEFVSPNPNVEASLKGNTLLLENFLITRGIDPKSIAVSNSGSNSYSSAIERLLAMIDQFRASKEDFDLFKVVENKLHMIVTKYLSVLSGTEYLDQKYWTTVGITNAKLSVQFKEPQMVETKSEMLDNLSKEIDLGISDKVIALSKIEGISEDEAIKRIEEIESRRTESIRNMQDSLNPQETPMDTPNGINQN